MEGEEGEWRRGREREREGEEGEREKGVENEGGRKGEVRRGGGEWEGKEETYTCIHLKVCMRRT